LRSGTGEALFEEERQDFTAPCVIFVPALAVHGFRFSSDMDGTIMTVVSRHAAALLQATPELRARLEASHCLRFAAGSDEFARIDRSVATIGEELSGSASWRMAVIEAALSMALLLTGRAVAAGLGSGQSAAPRSLAHAQRFRALLDRWFREQRSIGFYADQLGITPTQLNRVCREVLDTSALGALHARLVLEAKRDLAYTILSIKEIALTLGFADAAYFTRFFAKETGLAPGAFREAARRQLHGRIGSSRSSRYLR
jgi:AraC family transcriptional activator of pobA